MLLFEPVHADTLYSFKYPPSGINTLALAAVLNAPAVTVPSKSALYA
jgi:hypothetical protein